MRRFRELALLEAPNAIAVMVLMTAVAFPLPLYTALVILTICKVAIGAILLWLLPASAPSPAAL